MPAINQSVIMSGVEYFSDEAPINPFMDASVAIDLEEAANEHDNIAQALRAAGVRVEHVAPPANCQDGVFTANWALVRDGKAVLARLPNARRGEEAYAKLCLEERGIEVVELPEEIAIFSGQGDALPCGEYLLCGSGYRSEVAAQVFAAETLGFKRVQLHAKPQLIDGQPAINAHSGLPDSFYYDIDLAVSVLKAPEYDGDRIVKNGLVGYCPAALDAASVAALRGLEGVDLIEVSEYEAVEKLACNLVSTGSHVVMNDAPEYAAAIEARGLSVTRLNNPELAKGGGSVRCTTLTIG